MFNFLNYGVWCPPIKTPKINRLGDNKFVKDTYKVKTVKEEYVIIFDIFD